MNPRSATRGAVRPFAFPNAWNSIVVPAKMLSISAYDEASMKKKAVSAIHDFGDEEPDDESNERDDLSSSEREWFSSLDETSQKEEAPFSSDQDWYSSVNDDDDDDESFTSDDDETIEPLEFDALEEDETPSPVIIVDDTTRIERFNRMLAQQKRRAMACWDRSYQRGNFDESLYNEVRTQLECGMVPPIFHAISLDESKRLFAPNTTVNRHDPESGNIALTSTPVVEGVCTFDDSSVDKALWDHDEFSYLDAFFAPDGFAYAKVSDRYLQGYTWNFSAQYTKDVAALVNTPAEMIGRDLEQTALRSTLDIDKHSGTNLITRSFSRGVVADSFHHSKPGSNHAIVGTPGIGKSWSLLYALQQSLLYENACILFCSQKKGCALACIRRNHHIYVWKLESPVLRVDCGSGLFKNSNVVVLLDPSNTMDERLSYADGNRRLIAAAPIGEQYFQSVYRDTYQSVSVLNLFSDEELAVALKYMSATELTEEQVTEMLNRSKVVGNLPRYLGDDIHSDALERKIKAFAGDENRIPLRQLFNSSQSARQKPTQNIEEALFSLCALGTFLEDGSAVDPGYDGDSSSIDFGNAKRTFTGGACKKEIAMAYSEEILKFNGQGTATERSLIKEVAEELFWDYMQRNVKLTVFKLISGEANAKSTQAFYFRTVKDLGFRPTIQELGESFLGTGDVRKKCRMSRSTPMFQFAGPGRQVFSVSTSNFRRQLVDIHSMKDLLLASGILKEDAKGRLKYTRGFDNIQYMDDQTDALHDYKLNLYWVVPYGVSQKWIERTPLKLTADDVDTKEQLEANSISEKNFNMINSCFNECVDQHVIIMNRKLHDLQEERHTAWLKKTYQLWDKSKKSVKKPSKKKKRK